MEREGFEHVTRENPCQICGKFDWCARLSRYHLCMRIKSDKPAKKGGWLHPKDEDSLAAPIPSRPKRKSDEELNAIWQPIAEAAAREGQGRLAELARQLGVSVVALAALGVGFCKLQGRTCWTFPERNSRGWIVGIQRRLVVSTDGRNKLFCKGGRRGLTYCDGWDRKPGSIWLVEGGSDVAAGITMGLCVIGRPSNTGGISDLVELLANTKRRIVVCGENDRKPPLYVKQSNPDHNPKCRGCMLCWPGKAGAILTALALTGSLHKAPSIVMPPHGCKDMREFVARIPQKDIANYQKAMRAGSFA